MATHAIQANITGGSALERHLREIEKRLGQGAHVRVGFLEGATYPAAQAEADKEPGYAVRGINKAERRQRNLDAKHASGAALHVAQVAFWNEFGANPKGRGGTPARPFFRTMIERKSPRWGNALGVALRQTGYDAEKSLSIMGEVIKGQLVHSINEWTTPTNAKKTVEKKGFNKPLTDTALMKRSVDYQVMSNDTGDDE